MKAIAIALLAMLALPAHAAEEFCSSGKPHAVDIESEARMEKAVTTADMREVQGWTHEAWDKELNRVYAQLMQGLEKDKDGATKLRAAQKAWLRFRDAEVEWLWSKAMHGRSGTAGPLNVSGAATTMLRQRVCDLTLSLQARENGT